MVYLLSGTLKNKNELFIEMVSYNKMDAELFKYIFDFLNRHRNVANNNDATHVSMGEPRGSFYINKNDINKFWSMYCDFVWEKNKTSNIHMSKSRTWPCLSSSSESNNNVVCCIAEKLPNNIPIIVDVDLESATKLDIIETGSTLYNYTHIHRLIKLYYSIVVDIFQDIKFEDMVCVVLEKPPYVLDRHGERRVKNGFHLHFPNININLAEQKAHIFSRVDKSLEDNDIFQDIRSFINTDRIVDDHIYSAPWLLYGSQKSPASGAYKMSSILMPYESKEDSDGIGLREISVEEAFKDTKIEWIHNKSIEWHLPMLLSVLDFYKVRVTKPIKPSVLCISKYKIVHEPNPRYEYSDNGSLYTVDEAVSIAGDLIKMFQPKRAEVYEDWIKIGWALYNISDGSNRALNLWDAFSARCQPKYNHCELVELWNQMVKRNVTMGTLRWYASIDSPDAYRNYCRTFSEKYISQTSITPSHYDIAKLMSNDYGTEFACVAYKDDWLYFNDHIWNESKKGVDLRKKISTSIVSKYTAFEGEILKRIRETQQMCDQEKKSHDYDDDEAPRQLMNYDSALSKLKKKLKNVQKLIVNLKTHNFKNAVMGEAAEVFFNGSIVSKLNTDPYMIAFSNGVYDLKNSIFRDGRPDDHISMKMPIRYRNFKESDTQVIDVYDFLSKVFPDEAVRQYFLDVMSDVFVGKNSRKHVYIWTGDGDNGKSVTQLLFEKMLGQLACKPPTSLITGKRGMSNSASPETARMGNGVRWVVFDEPEKKDMINTGILKQLSGNDTYFARKLFSDGMEVTPMFKMCIICNAPPVLPYDDKAVWNRIRVIPFESTFLDYDEMDKPCNENIKYKFYKDPNFSDKIPDMIEALAWVLLNHRTTKDPNLYEPEKVKMATEMYRTRNDVYRQFIADEIVKTPGNSINITELYTGVKEWYRHSYPGHNMPTRQEVQEYFDKLWSADKRIDPTGLLCFDGYKIRSLLSNNTVI